MSSPELILSFNEILFYFTRAAVGVGVPVGLAEDFGRSSVWIGSSGLDPARITSNALQALDCGRSGLNATLTEGKKETVLTPTGGKRLSALQAGSAVCDWISEKTEDARKSKQFIAKNVDYPFLAAAEVGLSNFEGWKICWQASEDLHCSVFI